MEKRDYLEVQKEWRDFFTSQQLRKAKKIVEDGNYKNFRSDEDSATVQIGGGKIYRPVIQYPPVSIHDDWDDAYFECNCSAARPKYDWFGDIERDRCAHEAALLMIWEKAHGPWVARETDEEWEDRKEQERYDKELKRRDNIKKKEEKITRIIKESDFDPANTEEKPYFNVPAIINGAESNQYAFNMAEDLLKNNKISFSTEPMIDYGSNGRQVLRFGWSTDDEFAGANTSLSVSDSAIYNRMCSCRKMYRDYGNIRYEYGDNPSDTGKPYCGHELAGLNLAWKYIRDHDPGDATDKSAEQFLSLLDGSDAFEEQEENVQKEKEKKKNVSIIPRLLIQQNGLSLSFKISKSGGKPMILKGFRDFQNAIDNENIFTLGKSLVIDFESEAVEDNSIIWLDYIYGRISDADRINSKIANSRYSYYASSVTVKNNESLTGPSLDQFYAMTEGMDIECENKVSGKKGTVHVGESICKLQLRGNAIKQKSGRVDGITLLGKLPTIARGQNNRYIVTDKVFSIVSDAQWAAISPFRSVADIDGSFGFNIGKNRLAEFYYRILPGIMDSPYIDFDDNTEGAMIDILPPEPVFTFKLDMQDDNCVLSSDVAYDENLYRLSNKDESAEGVYRDWKQEKRAVECIERFFPEYDADRKLWLSDIDDDAVFSILGEGISRLNKFGEVLVTDAISSRSIKRMSPVTFSVSVDSGLLDISVLSKGVSPDELLQIYNSYRLKRKYHKLKDGSYLNLQGDDSFSSIEEVARELDLSVEDMISQNKNIPLYRALYLDHLLKEHEELVGSRDRTYRALIKGFNTIRDADYDVPEDMEDILRPYQVYGHKWLRTVTEAGFGGILADEMGLGKTLEAISVIESMKQSGSLDTALVVCPASLVYNWEEEIHRFAPDISAVPVAGNVASRKSILKDFGTDNKADVYITSYDLLRSDIDQYKELRFSIMIIDEAQYIKNTKAAMTKAVKIVHADKRLALTGTPIENRLAELWSIFDYLMPGFLHNYKTFAEKFEVPITKNKDEAATAKLKSMVGPFILRRRKGEVLKDLPPKLEEVRYARLEKKQRQLYDAQVVRMKEILEGGSSGEDKIKILAELTRIRQICCDPGLLFEDYNEESAKREACIELVNNAIGGGHKMLIFSQFTSMLELLEQDLNAEKIAYYKITGSTPKDKRIRDVHAFNEDDTPVFLISLKAGGTGLNLTGADMVIHYDPWWNIAAQNQATDRAHRIGQEKTVTVYRLIAKDTIEERILQMQEAKKDLADAILSGEQQSLMSLTDEELLALL